MYALLEKWRHVCSFLPARTHHGRVFKSFIMYAYMPDWETRERHLHAHTSETTKKSKRIAIA